MRINSKNALVNNAHHSIVVTQIHRPTKNRFFGSNFSDVTFLIMLTFLANLRKIFKLSEGGKLLTHRNVEGLFKIRHCDAATGSRGYAQQMWEC